MELPAEKLEDIKALMALFEAPGSLDGGGVTRLGYGPEEDLMHEIFRTWGEMNGFIAYTDAVGNSKPASSGTSGNAARTGKQSCDFRDSQSAAVNASERAGNTCTGDPLSDSTLLQSIGVGYGTQTEGG